LDDNSQESTTTTELVCLSDCEIMLIPKMHIIRSYKIKYRLEEKESGQLKSRRMTEYDEKNKEKLQQSRSLKKRENSQKVRGAVFTSTQGHTPTPKGRPRTSVIRKDTCTSKDIKSLTFYNPKRQSPTSKKYIKTEGSEASSVNYSEKKEENYGLN
jgi:hypothetical protein